MWFRFLTAAVIQVNDGPNGVAVTGPGLFGGDVGSVFRVAINTVLFLGGAIAVIMVVVGGMRYVLSGGNAKAVEEAKNTILFAVIGLAIASAAYAVVNFVLAQRF